MKQPPRFYIIILLCIASLSISTLGCILTDLLSELISPVSEEDLNDLQAALDAEVVDHRSEVVDYLGFPDAFDIAIVEVEGGSVRRESWRYFQYGTRVDFVDGEAVLTVEIEPVPEGTLFAAWYDPRAFEAGMTVEEVSQLIREASPADAAAEQLSLSPGGEDLVGGEVLVGDQIMVGFYEGRLVYVETVGLVPEGGQQ